MNPNEMTREQAAAEYRRIGAFRSHSTADLRRMNQCLARLNALSVPEPKPIRSFELAEKVARFPRVAGGR